MFLSAPRHHVSSLSWGEGALAQSLLYDLTKWRDTETGLLGRVTTQLGYAALVLVALVETIVRTPFAIISRLSSSEAGVKGYSMAVLSIALAGYGFFVNLFVEKVSSYFSLFHAKLYSHPEVALFEAASIGDKPLCEYLLKNGADPHKKFGGFTAAMAPRLFNHHHLHELFSLTAYEKEFCEAKLLTAWHNLEGEVEIDQTKIELEGATSAFHAYYLRHYLSQFFSSSPSLTLLSPQKQEILIKALTQNESAQDYEKTVEQIHRKELVFLDAGWKRHGISLAFYGDYLAIGNRGPGSSQHGTLAVYKIDPRKVDTALIEAILSQESVSEEKGISYFYDILPKLLSSDGKALTQFKEIAPKPAKSNNCALSCKKASLRFAWAMLLSDQPLQVAKREIKCFLNWAGVRIGELDPPSLNDPKNLLKKSASSKYGGYRHGVPNCDRKTLEIAHQAFQTHLAVRASPIPSSDGNNHLQKVIQGIALSVLGLSMNIGLRMMGIDCHPTCTNFNAKLVNLAAIATAVLGISVVMSSGIDAIFSKYGKAIITKIVRRRF